MNRQSGREGSEPVNTDTIRERAFRLWETGKKEKAWQLLLKTLELRPDDRLAGRKCAEILKSLHRFEDILKLCASFLNLKPDDIEIKKSLKRLKTG